jgi:hypothetical protein
LAPKKYGKYVKKLSFRDRGNSLYRQVTSISGKPFGLDFHIEYGTYIAAGKMEAKSDGPHSHDFDQVMLWMAASPEDMGELGAEVELCLGEDMEKYMITTSTAVAVPKGLPHFPATISRMDRRFIYMQVSCSKEYREKSLPMDKEVFEAAPIVGWHGKHRSKVIDMAFIRKGPWHYGAKNQDDSGGSLAFIFSRDSEFDFLIMHESLKKAPYRFGPIPDKPHAHPKPEILFFMGTNLNDLSELGGEAELYLGKEMEKHVITEPTAVVIPKGLAHCPLIITRIDRPFMLTDVRPFGSEEFAAGKL